MGRLAGLWVDPKEVGEFFDLLRAERSAGAVKPILKEVAAANPSGRSGRPVEFKVICGTAPGEAELVGAEPFDGKEALGGPVLDAVSYTHLTLPTNREV